MESKLVYTIIFIIGSFVLDEVYAGKGRPMPTDQMKPLECTNKNDTTSNSLVCCASFPLRQGVCAALTANITSGKINAVTLVNPPNSFTEILRTTVNSTGLTCKSENASSLQVCLNVTSFDKSQVCFKVSAKNGTTLYQSSITCASLPTLKVNGTSGTIRRDLASSLDLYSILGRLTNSSGGGRLGIGQIFGLLSILNSLPDPSDLADLSDLSDVDSLFSLSDLLDLSNLTGLLGGLSAIFSIFNN